MLTRAEPLLSLDVFHRPLGFAAACADGRSLLERTLFRNLPASWPLP